MRGRSNGNSGKRPYLKPDVYKFYDDLSGFPQGSDQKKVTWDGMRVTSTTFYSRQPQDFPLITRGLTTVPDARPLNEYAIQGSNNYHVAGTLPDDNYLVFQDNSFIGFQYYPDEYIGNLPSE